MFEEDISKNVLEISFFVFICNKIIFIVKKSNKMI